MAPQGVPAEKPAVSARHLRVKTFLGTKENAVQTQIWTALIAILLMKYLQMRSRWSWSMSNLIAAFRFCMFAHKDLWGWLDDPRAKKAPKPRRGYGLFSG